MTKNVSTTESYFRIGLGALAGVAALTVVKSGWAKGLLGAVAVSGLQSGFTRHCALKQWLGAGEAKKTLPGAEGSVYDASAFDSSVQPVESQAV